MKIPKGMIKLDSPFAKKVGFTSDKFRHDSYLWGFAEGLMISNIASDVKGSFKAMMQNIEKNKFNFRIPTPSTRMQEIGEKQGWRLGDDPSGLTFLTNEKPPKELNES